MEDDPDVRIQIYPTLKPSRFFLPKSPLMVELTYVVYGRAPLKVYVRMHVELEWNIDTE